MVPAPYDKDFFFFFTKEIVVNIKTHEKESGVIITLIIYYIIRIALQKGLTFVIVTWSYKNWKSNTHNQCGINIPFFFFFSFKETVLFIRTQEQKSSI